MTYSATAIDDLRHDLGDVNRAFDDGELARLLERAVGKHYVALAMGIFQLITQSARFSHYVTSEVEDFRNNVHAQLIATYNLLMMRPDVKDALGENSPGGKIVQQKFNYTDTRKQGITEFGYPDPFIWNGR